MFDILLWCRSLATPALNFFLDQLEELSRLVLSFDNGFLRSKGDEGFDASGRDVEKQSYNFGTNIRSLNQKLLLDLQDIGGQSFIDEELTPKLRKRNPKHKAAF